MTFHKLAKGAVAGALTIGLAACGGPTEDTTADGVEKEGQAENIEKSDAWNYLNNPTRFQTELVYDYNELKEQAEGQTENEVWPDTYWPTYKDGINQRWQGANTLSPAEKYDLAFNDWTPEAGLEEYRNMQPYDTDTCEYDEKLYNQIGPAAKQASKQKGNWKAHNGVDDDGDGNADTEECGYGEDKDYEGIETWFGLCHAWVPAAMLESEPKKPVTVENDQGNEVTFEVADIKALLVSQYDRADAHMVGGRCNDKNSDVDRDDSGRIEDGQCQDVNAGSFHVLITNFLGLQGRPIAEDKTFDYEVWNQPIISYEITNEEKISQDKVEDLVAGDELDENSEPETDQEKEQVLRAANMLSEDELNNDTDLGEAKIEAILSYRDENNTFEDYTTLEEAIGARAGARLLDYAYETGWLEEDKSIYDYNKNADSYRKVSMSVDYVTESSASTEPLADKVEQYTRTDKYNYILELDEQGKITGGEWVGRSIENHPDFLWLPTEPGGGNRNVSLETVRQELLEKSTSSDDSDSDVPSEVQTFESTETVSIPDAEPEGVTSTQSVDSEGNIANLNVDLEITHTYRGDLLVLLEKSGTTGVVYKGKEVDSGWKDDVSIEGKSIEGFEGMPASGDWSLKVVDTANRDTGSIQSWAINAKLK